MTKDLTTEKRLTIIKHLAAGKSLDATAALVRLDRQAVLDIASHHGYPSEHLLTKAVGLLEQKVEREAAIEDHPDPTSVTTRPTAAASTPAAVGAPQPLTRPDEIRVLLNTAKGHESKRIQAQANRVIDAVDRLKAMLREDEEKHADRRRIAAEKASARAEVERLAKQLAEAKARLRGPKAASKPAGSAPLSDSAQIRAWAAENDVECPAVGRVPGAVRAAYDEAHRAAS